MNNVTIKFAASSLAIGLTMVGCSASTIRPTNLASRTTKSEQQASQFAARAHQAVEKSSLADALGFAEQAVERAPRDAGYRMLLGDLYLKNGRFVSAETTFSDVLKLDPDNQRAGFNRALALIGLGNRSDALAQLEILSASAAPGDLGLAYALAGQPRRAVEMLEIAAREPGADGRVRQNLALAYAFSGEWQKARITAAQDVSPAQLDARLQQWASLANPTAGTNQLAVLLGVTPAEDSGQPARLALAPVQPETAAFAALEAPAPVAVDTPAPIVVESAPVETAIPSPATAPMFDVAEAQAPVPVQEQVTSDPQPSYVAAVQALVDPQPAVMRTVSANLPSVSHSFSVPRPSMAKGKPVGARRGNFVVQIGAFSSSASVERAWAQAYRRYGFAGHTPLSTTIGLRGKGTFHRLSVAGFATHSEAARTCSSIKAKGGACFVRMMAGDAPVRWASRYSSPRA